MKEIKIEDFNENSFELIEKDWMLVTAEKDNRVNTMTASWGGVGIIWGKTAATIYIRESRYTKEFIDGTDSFTLSIMPEKYRNELAYCGKASGRDEDKIAKCGFTVDHEGSAPYFKEARMVLVCRKMFAQKMTPESFTDKELVEKFYADKNWHTMYIAEIEKILIN